MNQEENILQLILQKENWEEVIYHSEHRKP